MINAGDRKIQISQIGQIAIDVQDLGHAVAFYRDVLGLPLLFEVPPGLAFFQCGNVRLMMEQPQGNQAVTRATSIVYYQVDDLDARRMQRCVRRVCN